MEIHMGYTKTQQKEYAKKHYQKNKALYQARDKARRDKLRRFIFRYKNLPTTKCVECGESRWECLDFHHTDPAIKTDTVHQMIRDRRCIKTVKSEIRKCQVLCANCHRVTHKGNVWE